LWRQIIMDKSLSQPGQRDRINERGAALIITLLVSTALLVAGGALIQMTSRSARNAIDSTAETQAYYAAEAGLNVALNVLRRNVPSNPVGKQATFRNAVDNPTLGPWLNYNTTVSGKSAVSLGNCAYSIEVIGDGTVAPKQPKRVIVQATGYGPNSAKKQMRMIIARNAFEATAPAMMTLIGTPVGSPPMFFDGGTSANHVYTGDDNAGAVTGLPAFGVTNPIDYAKAYDSASKNTTSDPKVQIVSGPSIPDYLQSPKDARAFLDKMRALADEGQKQNLPGVSYLPGGSSGTPTGFTFVNGNYTMGPGSGSGLLIVTGDLTTNGGTDFTGLILVIGKGSVNRNGGGGGKFLGATFIANVDWPVVAPAEPKTDFGAPFFNFNGAGKATMQYDSSAIEDALQTLPGPVLGVSEY
jgi:Tfp pilus assembly protein PilX